MMHLAAQWSFDPMMDKYLLTQDTDLYLNSISGCCEPLKKFLCCSFCCYFQVDWPLELADCIAPSTLFAALNHSSFLSSSFLCQTLQEYTGIFIISSHFMVNFWRDIVYVVILLWLMYFQRMSMKRLLSNINFTILLGIFHVHRSIILCNFYMKPFT